MTKILPPEVKFWVHKDGLTGQYYTTTHFGLATSKDVNDAHIYRSLKGARNQIKGRIETYRNAVDLMEGWKKNAERDWYYKEHWPSIEQEGIDAQAHLKDPTGHAYIEIVEVTSIVKLKKVDYK